MGEREQSREGCLVFDQTAKQAAAGALTHLIIKMGAGDRGGRVHQTAAL